MENNVPVTGDVTVRREEKWVDLEMLREIYIPHFGEERFAKMTFPTKCVEGVTLYFCIVYHRESSSSSSSTR